MVGPPGSRIHVAVMKTEYENAHDNVVAIIRKNSFFKNASENVVPPPRVPKGVAHFSCKQMFVRMRRGAQNDSANAHERRATNSSSSVVVGVRRRLSFLVSASMSFRIPCHFGVVFSEKYRSGVMKDRSRFKVWSKQIF